MSRRRDPPGADLTGIDGIGATVAVALLTSFGQEAERGSIDKLVALLTPEAEAAPQTTDSPVAGKTVVFTGTLEKMTRAEAKARAEALGGQGVRRCQRQDRPVGRRAGRGQQSQKSR